jgi:hypothetical protein
MTVSLPVPPADPRDIETPAARVCAQFYLRATVADMRARREEANAMASYWGGRVTAGVVAASAFLMPGTRTHRWPVSGPLERAVFAGRSVEELFAVAESMVPTPPPITASAAEDHAYDFLALRSFPWVRCGLDSPVGGRIGPCATPNCTAICWDW